MRWTREQEKAWDEGQHPRDEHGRFTDSGGGDGGDKKHPGEGYSKDAWVNDEGVIQTTDVSDAARALHENRKVSLDQPQKISMLLHKLGAVSKEIIAKGEKAPNYNLCNVTIANTSLFCIDNVGIPRIKMPQLDDDQTKEFRKHLEAQGFKITKEEVPAAYLHATQNELNGVKVAGIAEFLLDKPDHHSKRLIVSRDNYILDGHHHFAAKVGLDAADNVLTNDTPMRIARVDIDIITLLNEAEKFTGGKGHKGAEEITTGKNYPTTILAEIIVERLFDPSQPRDEHGRWTDGGGSSITGDAPTSFVSPNVSNLTFEQAVAALKSPAQVKLSKAAGYIDSKLGINSKNFAAIGAWSDGAENSLMVIAPGASVPQMRAASAMKGYLADQKAVLVFEPGDDNRLGKRFDRKDYEERDLESFDKMLADEAFIPMDGKSVGNEGAIGYILPDGTPVDISGDSHDSAAERVGSTLSRMQDAGAIRFYAEPAVGAYDQKGMMNLQMLHPPTREQIATIKTAIGQNNFERLWLDAGEGFRRETILATSRSFPDLLKEAMPEVKGQAFLAHFAMKGELGKIHTELLQRGLIFHTLEPTRDGATVHIYGDNNDTIDKIQKTSTQYGTQVYVTRGSGEFIGTTKEDGTDREQRDDARRVYEETIRSIADTGRMGDLAGVWKDVRDHWNAGPAKGLVSLSSSRRQSYVHEIEAG